MTELSDALIDALQGEQLVLITTRDSETGLAANSAISWVVAAPGGRSIIRFAADGRSKLVSNLRSQERVILTVMGAGSVYALHGSARVAEERIGGVSLKLAMVEVAVDLVEDIMFFGGRLSGSPTYEKTYDPAVAAKLDREVYGALRQYGVTFSGKEA